MPRAGTRIVVSPDVVEVKLLEDVAMEEMLEDDVETGASSGVAGADGDGEADSTTHIRWDFVATSLATVDARVE